MDQGPLWRYPRNINILFNPGVGSWEVNRRRKEGRWTKASSLNPQLINIIRKKKKRKEERKKKEEEERKEERK